PGRHRRRHGRRPLPRLEPLLVDRRPPPQLPVRHRDRLGDQGWKEGPDVQEPDVHRDHLRALALVRRGRRRLELGDARDAELRQGRARPGRPRGPRLLGRPVPERPGRSRQVVSEPEAIDPAAAAERVVGFATAAGADEAEALVSVDHARLTRFANSEIHQNVAETNGALNLRVAMGKRVGVASSNRLDEDGLRRLAETAVAIARNSAELEDWGGLPEPTPVAEIPAGGSDAPAGATPEQRAEGVRAVIAAADAAGVRAFGS